MADALDVISYAEAQAGLKIGVSDTSNTARLERAITAVSRRLDDEFGPIVKRSVAAKTYEPCGVLWVSPSPIFATPAITITEYNTSGASQALTLETFETKPAHGYRLQPRDGLGDGFTGLIVRTRGASTSSWGTVRVAYDAGRYATTATVAPVFKEAAIVTLISWWQQVLATSPATDAEFDLPTYRFPRRALPSVVDIVPDDERPGRALA